LCHKKNMWQLYMCASQQKRLELKIFDQYYNSDFAILAVFILNALNKTSRRAPHHRERNSVSLKYPQGTMTLPGWPPGAPSRPWIEQTLCDSNPGLGMWHKESERQRERDHYLTAACCSTAAKGFHCSSWGRGKHETRAETNVASVPPSPWRQGKGGKAFWLFTRPWLTSSQLHNSQWNMAQRSQSLWSYLKGPMWNTSIDYECINLIHLIPSLFGVLYRISNGHSGTHN